MITTLFFGSEKIKKSSLVSRASAPKGTKTRDELRRSLKRRTTLQVSQKVDKKLMPLTSGTKQKPTQQVIAKSPRPSSSYDIINRRMDCQKIGFTTKNLQSGTMIVKSYSPRAKFNFHVNAVHSFMPKVKRNFDSKYNDFLLGTENTLSTLYTQSLNIQEYIYNNPHAVQTLGKKLETINQLIYNENSKLSSS